MKKTVWHRSLCVLLTCVFLCAGAFPAFAGTRAEDAHLHFGRDGRFRILNFSDIQDDETLDDGIKCFIRRAVSIARPDLIVLTGDNIYGPIIDEGAGNTEKAIAQFMDIFEELGVPVAIVFGNHDDDHQCGTAKGFPLSKEEQMVIYNKYKVNISHDEGSDIDGCGTYNVPIYGSAEPDKVKFNLWMFDTGSDGKRKENSRHEEYAESDHMRESQLNWYVNKSNELKETNGGVLVPSIAFQHIIVKEIYDALDCVSAHDSFGKDYVKHDSKRYILPNTAAPGSVMKEAPGSSAEGDEFSVVSAQGDVLAIVSGHDHLNSFIVPYQGIDLINTPGLMVGDYGDPALRGARIIDIYEPGVSRRTEAYTTEMLIQRNYVGPQSNTWHYYEQNQATKYVKNIALCVEQSYDYRNAYRNSEFAAHTAAYGRLYDAVDAANGNGVALWADLNAGSTLDLEDDNHYVICMGYTLTEDPAEAMRGLGLCFTDSEGASGLRYDGATADGRTWQLCNRRNLLVSGTDGAVNLNAGTDGNAIYFVASYGTDGAPLTAINIVNTGFDDPIDMWDFQFPDADDISLVSAVVGSRTGSGYADLNKTAWGDYVYALYAQFGDKHRTITPLDTWMLREMRFRAVRKLQDPDKLCPETYLTALQSALDQADAILHYLDEEDSVTNKYDQGALDAAAYRIAQALLPLEKTSFTVTFDANGGTCDEQSRTIVCGETVGELPSASKVLTYNDGLLKTKGTVAYTFEGWFTEREGGERITPETVFTAAFDQTWYAHWSCGLPEVSAKPNDPVSLGKECPVADFPDQKRNDSERAPRCADVNADSLVDLKDVTLLQRHIVGGWGVALDASLGDVNADGQRDLRDAVLLQRYLAGGWNIESLS